MTSTRLFAFDLDDTLAPSKSPVPAEIAELLVRLLERFEVCVISGGQFEQFKTQLVDNLPADLERFPRLHLMPTCGTQYFRFDGAEFQPVYAEVLTESERDAALESLERHARALGLWESDTWGPILEDRGSQVTFSALGQAAPVDAKKAWDPTGEKKSRLRDAVQHDVPELEVRSGGSTSVDITRRGIDKAYGMQKLVDHTGISLEEMVFVGDRLDPDGNDYPVKALGVACVAVEGWEDTAAYLRGVLNA
ncbi:MAG TPA: HAD-IIB family hydrolase [Microbacteriaceae bacterium]|nr:HAD-IIB family hydrolase [Microbacteriaceae bacterium]